MLKEQEQAMKGREGKGAPPADLVVCFPSRAHLSLMPKPICSPSRPSEPNIRHGRHHHHRRKSFHRGSGGKASPLLWAKTKPTGSEITSEPTSPKVTCAGQIKVRTKSAATSCKNWQSVMEEIERIHNSRSKHKKNKPNWVESLGFKKEIVHFMACLRNIRFDFRCFGSPFPGSDLTSDDEEDVDDEEEEEHFPVNRTVPEGIEGDGSTIFSKWFMVLQENQNNNTDKQEEEDEEEDELEEGNSGNGSKNEEAAVAPPSNALLLMRCRSAPAKTWLEEKEEEERLKREGEKVVQEEEKKGTLMGLEEEKKQRKENLVVMRYGSDFHKLSSEIAKETWVVGGIRDPFCRSRSWRR